MKINAHEIIDGGTASLLIHIDPDNIAVAKKPTTIHIDLINSEKGFSLEKCNCTLSISQVIEGEDEKEILSTSLSPANEASDYNVKGVPFTFPDNGEYHINVSGEPTVKNLFTSFEIEVQEKVLPAGTTNTATTSSHAHTHQHPKIMLAGTIIFTLVMGYFLFSNNEYLVRRIARK